MNALILYDGKADSVEECVRILEARLSGSVTTYAFGTPLPVPGLDAYDEVILGSAAGFGGISRAVSGFCDRERKRLIRKKLGLFLCTTAAPEKAKEYFEAFPRDILDHAAVLGLFGSTGDFGGKGYLDRLVSTEIAHRSSGSYSLDRAALEEFAEKFEAL